jgi:hypothetical protein
VTGSARPRTWAGNTHWRPPISAIAPSSTAFGKLHTDRS